MLRNRYDRTDLFAPVPQLGLRFEPRLEHLDRLLDDDEIVERVRDDLCVVRSMHADVPNHEPSLMLMNCGEGRQVRPSMGAWITYGLGSENQNLPGFIA